MTEDTSQTIAPTPEDTSLVTDTHVTAAAPAVDNATLTPDNDATAAPQTVVDQPGTTGEDVDESGIETQTAPKPSLSDYQKRKQDFLAGKTSTPAPEAAPAPQAKPAPAAPQAQTTDEEEFPSAPDASGRMPQIKLRPVTPVDVRAMAEYKASQKAGGMESFIEFIHNRYPAAPAKGTETAPAAEPVVVTDETTPATPKSVKDLDARLKELKNERYQKLEEFDFTEARRIEEEEETLRGTREALLHSESEQQTAEQTRWEAQETEYLTKVGAMFPQAKTASDPLVVKANEILQGWYDKGDARAQHPSRAMYCYVEAAAELGIQPGAAAAKASTPPLKTSTPSPVHRAPISAAIIAPGTATQTQTRTQVDTRTYEQRKADYLNATAPTVRPRHAAA